MAESVSGEWDEELFRNNISQALKSGSFILVIVVDEINEELNRIIKYINECSSSVFSLHALEMNRFQFDSTEILVPHLHGTSTKPSTETQRKQWTSERFFKVLSQSNPPGAVKIVEDLYNWTREAADRTWFGNGIEEGSFTFHYLKEGRTIAPFSVWTNGKIALDFGYLNQALSNETLQEFYEKITKIPTLQQIPASFNKFPSVRVEALGDPENMYQFKEAVTWLKKQPVVTRKS